MFRYRVSQECWIMVEQIPLVECGNYYSLFLEVEYDCVKDPLGKLAAATAAAATLSCMSFTSKLSLILHTVPCTVDTPSRDRN